MYTSVSEEYENLILLISKEWEYQPLHFPAYLTKAEIAVFEISV